MNLDLLKQDFTYDLYFNSYKELVAKQKDISGYFEKHHIIPRCYFNHYKLPIDNSKNNIIKLTYSDHILAHYYLYKACSNFQLKCKLAKALLLTMNKLDLNANNFTEIDAFLDTNLNLILNDISQIKIAASIENRKNAQNI